MEILRVPPYPLVSEWDVPLASTDYLLQLEDLVDHSVESIEVTSNEDSKVVYELPKVKVEFDRNFAIRIYDLDGNIVVDSNLNVYRPYVDPNMLGSSPSEIEEYKMLEVVARAIIDDYTNDGFYNHKMILEGAGLGSDYFSIWHPVNKVLKVYENDVLVYDYELTTLTENVYEYRVTMDNSAIIKLSIDPANRLEGGVIQLPKSKGDLWFNQQNIASFPKGYDYKFVLDAGYKAVPPEVEYATKLLIEDIKCGKLDYYKRHMSQYSTDQFKIASDTRLFDGTGNLIVDKILNRYVKTIQKLGVL